VAGSSADDRRYCRCGARLAADNSGDHCAACQRQLRDRLLSPPVVPVSFWLTPQMRDAFAAQHIGRVARAYRQHSHHQTMYGAAGISQTLLGQWLGLTQAQVSRIENGAPVRNIDTLTHWARVLRIPPDLLWFDMPGHRRVIAASVNELFDTDGGLGVKSPLELNGGEWLPAHNSELAELLREGAELPINAATVTRLVHEWLVTEPPQLAEVQAGRRIGDGLVIKVERRIAELRRIDDFVAGGDLHVLVEQELHATAALLRESSYSEPSGRRLLVAIGELCQLAGWVVGDAGRYDAAAHYYIVGVKAAHAANNPGLAGNLISTLAYQVANVGNPREAVLLAQSADAGSKQSTPTVQALFKERLAWAYAKTGERRSTERTLAAVEIAYERRVPGDDPEWVYWLDEDEINIMAGRCHVELGQADRAVPLLTGVLEHYDVRRTRELALYTSWLAEAHVQLGAIDEAAAAAIRTLELTSQITSARGDDRVNVLRRKLQRYRDVPAVADFEVMIRELGNSA
jgi:transcriptional regulator with XRE-family HTH domain